MPDRLIKRVFCAELLEKVRGFDCGGAPWETEVADWIRSEASDGALESVKRGACQAWLYEIESGDVVGFGSLGVTRWNWPDPDGARARIHIIPNIAVASRFRGQPPGPRENHYSCQIVLDLLSEAARRPDVGRAVALFVHPENERAERFYSYLGFTPWSHSYTDRATGVVYRGMLIGLPGEANG